MSKLKVLVVDDKQIIGDFFDFTLGYKGHEIIFVQNPYEALEEVAKGFFDIAFMDIIMPGKDGVETLEEMKKIAPELPVVMMSGYSLQESRDRAKELGAITCLKKPFEFEDVRKVVKTAIGQEI